MSWSTIRKERVTIAGEMMCTPVALPGTVLKITETVVVAGVSLRIVKLTTPPSLTVYIVGSNPTITTADETSHNYCATSLNIVKCTKNGPISCKVQSGK